MIDYQTFNHLLESLMTIKELVLMPHFQSLQMQCLVEQEILKISPISFQNNLGVDLVDLRTYNKTKLTIEG